MTINELLARNWGAMPFERGSYADPTLGFHDSSGKRHSVRRTADWLRSVQTKLGQLATLDENWDTYGARAIDADAIAMANVFAAYLAKVDTVHEPLVTGTPDGSVGFCWEDSHRSLDVEIRSDGLLMYSLLDEEYERDGSTREVDDVVSMLTSF